MDNSTGGKIIWDLNLETTQFKKGLEEAKIQASAMGDHVSKVGSTVASALKVAAVAVVASGAAITAFGVSSVKAFSESQNLIAQTNAVLASTKGVAGVTAKAVDDLSKALQRQTTYSDEDVRSVENLLLTFTAIGQDIFPQSTKAVLNMATALGEDTKSASIQLGKALQDPILGITALRRVGVNFNDAQKEVIKGLVETGHKAEAQQLILKELETEFGNSAEAARHTFGGSLKALKNQFNDIQEVIGGVIANSLQPFIQKSADFLASINWTAVIKNTVTTLRLLYDTFTGGDPTIKKGEEGFKSFAKILSTVQDSVIKTADAIIGYLQPKIIALWHTINSQLIPLFKQLWKDVLAPLIPVIGKLFVGAIGLAIDAVNAFIRVVKPIASFLITNRAAVIGLATAFGTLKVAIAIWDLVDKLRVSFAILSTTTLPGVIATFSTLAAFLATPMGLAIAGVALALGGLTAAFFSSKNNTDHTLDSTKALSEAYKNLKTDQDAVKDSAYNLEGANLRVEAAQKNYNEAVKNFGPDSFEARQALHELNGATKDAADNTNKLHDAQTSLSKDTSIIAAADANKAAIQRFSESLRVATGNAVTLFNTPVRSVDPIGVIGHNAGGTNFWGGGATWVGENGPEIVNLPRGSQVIPAQESSRMTSGGGSQIHIGTINIANEVDGERWLRKLTRQQSAITTGLVSNV